MLTVHVKNAPHYDRTTRKWVTRDENFSVTIAAEMANRLTKGGVERVKQVKVTILDKELRPVAEGIAHCSPKDRFDSRTGLKLAFTRALKDLYGSTPEMRKQFHEVFGTMFRQAKVPFAA